MQQSLFYSCKLAAHIFFFRFVLDLGLPLPKGRPLNLVRSIMDSVNFLNLMDKFEAGKEGERELSCESESSSPPLDSKTISQYLSL